ncbi:MAG: hypothetical protein IKD96_06360 [Oscillospiraceae bacterium]|nr:hypothetical protein [Oscillospiraceae bacterium]
MTKRATDIVAYLTLIGLIIAFVIGDHVNSKFHLNQALVLFLAFVVTGIISALPLLHWIGRILSIIVFVLWLIGLIRAIGGNEEPIPILGKLQLLK